MAALLAVPLISPPEGAQRVHVQVTQTLSRWFSCFPSQPAAPARWSRAGTKPHARPRPLAAQGEPWLLSTHYPSCPPHMPSVHVLVQATRTGTPLLLCSPAAPRALLRNPGLGRTATGQARSPLPAPVHIPSSGRGAAAFCTSSLMQPLSTPHFVCMGTFAGNAVLALRSSPTRSVACLGRWMKMEAVQEERAAKRAR